MAPPLSEDDSYCDGQRAWLFKYVHSEVDARLPQRFGVPTFSQVVRLFFGRPAQSALVIIFARVSVTYVDRAV